MILEKTFPTNNLNVTLFEQKLDDEKMNNKIIKEIDKQGDKQNHKTNVKAQMTQWSMVDRPGFKQLANIILDMSKTVAKQKYNVSLVPMINDLWGMKYVSEDYTIIHDHWPAVFGCVYYINPLQDFPGVSFPDLNIERRPEHGLLLMFPGWIKHGVKKKKFEGKRYCVSSNIHCAEYWTKQVSRNSIKPKDTTNK